MHVLVTHDARFTKQRFLSSMHSLVYLFSLFIGYSAISGLAALIFYFWIEAPFGELERLLFSRAPATKEELGEEEFKKQELVASVVVVPVSAATGPQEESTEAAMPQ